MVLRRRFDPEATLATAEKGRQAYEEAVRQLVRFLGWFKDRQADDVNPTYAKGWPIGNTALSIAGVSGSFSGYNVLPRINPSENRFQYADNLSWVKGAHSFKFGVDIARTEELKRKGAPANASASTLRRLNILTPFY